LVFGSGLCREPLELDEREFEEELELELLELLELKVALDRVELDHELVLEDWPHGYGRNGLGRRPVGIAHDQCGRWSEADRERDLHRHSGWQPRRTEQS
jgi:hypothetical protein